ncbi:TPA: hypothetical protein ACGFX5_003261, partial [Vibrio cholerae]
CIKIFINLCQVWSHAIRYNILTHATKELTGSKKVWGTSELRSAQCESSGQKLVSNFVALRQSLQIFFTSVATC